MSIFAEKWEASGPEDPIVCLSTLRKVEKMLKKTKRLLIIGEGDLPNMEGKTCTMGKAGEKSLV